jgi:predicted metal-binding protein
MGVPSIKKYVFGTDRLKEIRGASALLDDLNRNVMEKFLKEKIGNSVECIFVGGGAGQFIISAEKTTIEDSLTELASIFSKETAGGLRLTWGKAELGEGKYQQALHVAELDAQRNKEESPFHPISQLHTGYIRECESCSSGMASKYLEDNDKKLLLCKVCYEKTQNSGGARKSFGEDFEDYLRKRIEESKYKKIQQPQSFEKIGELSESRKGYTALVYADGNAMGKLIKKIETSEQFEFFSKTVDDAVREACHEALYDTFFDTAKEMPEILPAEILLLGGDDLMVYLSADAALPFAVKAAEKFNQITIEKMKADPKNGDFFIEKTGGKGLTISLGIAYGKSHTPFSLLLNQAEELLKNAKKAGSEDKERTDFYAPTYIDYHVSTYFNQISVKDSRKLNLEPPSLKLYQKPYSLEDAKAILHHAQELVNVGIPSTRLNRLGNAPTLGKINGILECLKLYTRTKAGKQRLAIWDALERFGCVRNMPWNEDNPIASTMLVDLIEIVGFCENNHSEENTDAA